MPQLTSEVIAMGMPNAATFTAIGGAVGMGTMAFKTVVKVERGQRGIRTRSGETERRKDALTARVAGGVANTALRLVDGLDIDAFAHKREGTRYGIVKPGLHITFPGVEAIHIVSIQNRSANIEDARVLSKENKLFEYNANIRWAVPDDEESIYKYWFNGTSELELAQIVVNACRNGAREVMDLQPERFIRDRTAVFSGLKSVTDHELGNFGVELRDFGISSITPAPVEILKDTMKMHHESIMGAVALGELNRAPTNPQNGTSGSADLHAA